jgi:hypothetical protein
MKQRKDKEEQNITYYCYSCGSFVPSYHECLTRGIPHEPRPSRGQRDGINRHYIMRKGK